MAEKIYPAGIDPTDPELVRRLRREADDVKQHIPGGSGPLIDAGDLVDDLTLGGLPCRPFSAGVLAVLEMIGSPLAGGKDGDGAETDGGKEDPDEKDLQFGPVIDFLYLMASGEEETELVELAANGAKAFHKAATVWSFRLDLGVMTEMRRDAEKLFRSFATTMELYGDPGSDDKKK